MSDTNMHDVNRARIARFISNGAVCVKCGKIGLELEHIIVKAGTHGPVGYSDPGGVAEILGELAPHYPEKTVDDGHLIGLACEAYNITIEPAGQLEISIAPLDTAHAIFAVYDDFRSRLDPILERLGLEALALGYHPTARADELELIPKERYRLMNRWFERTGQHGRCMMRGSASTQVSIDYSDDEDAIVKFKVANLLGPLFSFVFDNAPYLEGRSDTGRMARTRIWNDVDPERSMTVPHLFDEGFDTPYTLADYADYIMGSHPILVMEGSTVVDAGDRTSDEVYADRMVSRSEIEHLLSMFFPDVRLKRYVEIRMVDSLPIEYCVAYGALANALFYSRRNLLELVDRFTTAGIGPGSIATAKANLMRDGWVADVYGTPAWRWLDDIAALAWRGTEVRQRGDLAPFLELVERRRTLYDMHIDSLEDSPISETDLGRRYLETVSGLEGDPEGRIAVDRAVQASTAIYHDEVVEYSYVPQLLTPSYERALGQVAANLDSILTKMVDRYLADPEYRRLFGYGDLLEELVLADPGYLKRVPIMRVDLFRDRGALDNGASDGESMPAGHPVDDGFYPDGDLRFQLCEINTDGASAMNEDREVGQALMHGVAYTMMSRTWSLAPQSLFDAVVRMVDSHYAEWRVHHPTHPVIPVVGIVDFTDSSTPHEFEWFAKRFAEHGIDARICEIGDLAFERGNLIDTDGVVIDCVYRRAVTSDLLDRADRAHGFIEALRADAFCSVGAIRTQIPHDKRSFAVLHDPMTQAFLDDDEVRFIKRHVPYTTILDEDHVELGQVKADKDAWIVKPDDGYATKGVVAGTAVDQGTWEKTIDECAGNGFIIQHYVRQDRVPGIRGNLGEPGTVSGRELAVNEYNRMVGVFIYDGRFGGTYVRQGTDKLIGGPWDVLTVPTFVARPNRAPEDV